jgi:hypothetical protein
MVEQGEQAPAEILERFFPDNNAKVTAAESFVKAVSDVEGLSELVVFRFQTGIVRFYAIWGGQTQDREKVTKLWKEFLEDQSNINTGELFVIQYSMEEFSKIKDRLQLKDQALETLWKKR